jgi:hypothetical protein
MKKGVRSFRSDDVEIEVHTQRETFPRIVNDYLRLYDIQERNNKHTVFRDVIKLSDHSKVTLIAGDVG